MNDKQQLLTMLREEFNQWEALLAGMTEEQITARRLPSDLSIKDVIAHLRAWQHRSIARLEAALHNTEPLLPVWPAGLNPDVDDDLERINAWIMETYREQSWPEVHQAWRQGFQRFLELGEALPEADLLDAGKYAWLQGYPLAAVLQGSYEHHRDEHREPLRAWLEQHGDVKRQPQG